MELTYWSVLLSSRRGGKGVNGLIEGIVILARRKFYFIGEHESLVYDNSNNTSIPNTP